MLVQPGDSHLGVCDEDRRWAGSVQDFTAADFPDATPYVWIVPAQNLQTEGGKTMEEGQTSSPPVQELSLKMKKCDFVLRTFDGVQVPDCTAGGSTVLIMKEQNHQPVFNTL